MSPPNRKGHAANAAPGKATNTTSLTRPAKGSAPFVYSRGRRQSDAYPKIREVADFDAFEKAVLADRARSKGLQYFAAPFAPDKTGKPHRGKDTALPRRYLPLDVDEIKGPKVYAALRRWLADYRGFGYTTASSTPDAPRCRVVLELDRPVDRLDGERLGAAVSRDIDGMFGDMVSLGVQVYRAEQPCFGPLVDSETFRLDGEPIHVDEVLATAPPIDPERKGAGAINPDDDPVIVALKSRGLYRRDLGSGTHATACPWEQEHTTVDDDQSTATCYFQPFYGGYKTPGFKCLHDHCTGRTGNALLEALGIDWRDVSRAYGGISEPVGKSTTAAWPAPLADAAFHGLAGEIVKAIEPQSEADPAALLLQILIAFGALAGRGPHRLVEDTKEHHPNLYGVLVGDTSKARKGTSWAWIQKFFAVSNPPRQVTGLSTGEGIKWALRDDQDPLLVDKRMLVYEAEFAQVLRVGARAGNTLSTTIRDAWDNGTLATLTKNDPMTATDTHIAIVAHITQRELRAELTQTDQANGFANRFLFMAVRRSKLLPLGGKALADDVLAKFRARISAAANKARRRGAIGMTPAAEKIWIEAYEALSEGGDDLLAAVTARAEAQVIRLALVYALLDGAGKIDVPHLNAALAVWNRAEASARYVFGDTLGDSVADAILRGLKAAGAAGMTRTAIRDLFQRNQTADRIDAALESLTRRNLARSERRDTGGRPTEIWVCV